VQHGFRAKRSCETQLVCTIDDLAKNTEKARVTDVIILDFSKAFDCVNHRKLIHKITSYGINKTLVTWIEAFLADRTQVVVVDSKDLGFVCVSSGVPQGSVLGPLMFLLYINDLPEAVGSQCRLFADDALLYTTRDRRNELQNDLFALQNWALEWQMVFNPKKCFHLSVGEKSKEDSTFSFSLCGADLERVQSNPYLGVELQTNLKWELHIERVVSKARQLIGMLRRVLRDADCNTRMAAYKTIVRPTLEYGCPVWDPYLKKHVTLLERTQNIGLRFIFCLRGRVSFTELREKHAIKSLQQRRIDLRTSLFEKIVGGEVRVDVGVSMTRPPNQPPSMSAPPFLGTRRGVFYLPHIRTDQYFYSFWPRTAREARDRRSGVADC
jgi:hypothetical protein